MNSTCNNIYTHYINNNSIIIHYVDNLSGKIMKKAMIKFPTTWVNNNIKHKNNTLDKQSNIYNEDITVNENEYIVNNINLLPYMSIIEFKYLICSIIKIEYNNILSIRKCNDNDIIETVLPTNEDIIKRLIKKMTKNYKQNDIDIFESNISIGYAQYIVNVDINYSTSNINYSFMFYDNYVTIVEYINDMVANNKSLQNFSIDSYENYSSIQNIEVTLLYDDDNNMFPTIDIIKLFNITKTSDVVKKILINDNILTEYNNEDRDMQYVKTFTKMNDPFDNTFSRYNCCSVYMSTIIDVGVLLTRIEFYRNGIIKYCFIVNDPFIKMSDLKNILSQYFKYENFIKTLSSFNVNECVYDFSYDYKNIIPVYGSFSYIYSFDNVDSDSFINSYSFINQHIPSLVYKTVTSVLFTAYSSLSLNIYNEYLYTKTFKSILTDSTMNTNMMCRSHLHNMGENMLMYYITKCNSMDDVKMNVLMMLPIFHIKNNNVSKIDINTLPKEEQIRIIKNKYKSIPDKKNIKKLREIDPLLFGNRFVNNTDQRPYSALAQKKEQRVVPITKNEFELINSVYPESVANLRNQSQSEQRLYLLCPFDNFSKINYHHYHNQLCIPKCVSEITKQTQYSFCSEQLDCQNSKQIFEGNNSKMIVYYSPLLLPGRKCYPPDELSMICENYIMTKYSSFVDIYEICKINYGYTPFILTRNNNAKVYIINDDLEENTDYMLVLQSELDNGYYILLNDNVPFKLNDHKSLYDYIKSIQINKSSNYEIFDFINKVFNLQLHDKLKYKTFKEMFKTLEEEYDIQFVVDVYETKIIGVIKNNIFVFVPELNYNKQIVTLKNKHIDVVLQSITTGEISLPEIDIFNIDKIKIFYKDISDKFIHMIEYIGVNILIQPLELQYIEQLISNTYKRYSITLFDYKSFVKMYIYSNTLILKENTFITYQLKEEMINLIKQLILVFYVNYEIKTGYVKTFKQLLKDANIINDKETSINIISDNYHIISWRNSSINEKDFDNLIINFEIINQEQLIDLVYDDILSITNIYKNKEEFISSKIITNNTI